MTKKHAKLPSMQIVKTGWMYCLHLPIEYSVEKKKKKKKRYMYRRCGSKSILRVEHKTGVSQMVVFPQT